MIKDNIVYKQLVLKRDVCRFVMEMRQYTHICEGKNSRSISVFNYKEYIITYGNWNEKLASILDRAKELGINPNGLSTYYDGFQARVNELEKSANSDELGDIKNLDEEINFLIFATKAKTLVGELLDFYDTWNVDYQPFDRDILSDSIYTLIKMSPYDNTSPEYDYFMKNDSSDMDFMLWFQEYMLNKDITLDERKSILDKLEKSVLENGEGQRKLFWLIESEHYRQIPISSELLIYLIEQNNVDGQAANLVSELSKNKGNLPFTSEEYLDDFIKEVISGKQFNHYCGFNSTFQRMSWEYREKTPKLIGEAFTKIILSLCSLSALTPEEFFILLGNKVALLEGHLEIATAISDFLIKQCVPKEYVVHLAQCFTDAYLEASVSLKDSQKRLVMTLDKGVREIMKLIDKFD